MPRVMTQALSKFSQNSSNVNGRVVALKWKSQGGERAC